MSGTGDTHKRPEAPEGESLTAAIRRRDLVPEVDAPQTDRWSASGMWLDEAGQDAVTYPTMPAPRLDGQHDNALEARNDRQASLERRHAGRAQLERLVDNVLGESGEILSAGTRARLLEALHGHVGPLTDQSFGVSWLVESIARVIERTAPDANTDGVEAVAQRMEGARALHQLAIEAGPAAIARSVTELKVLIHDVASLRQRLQLLDDSSASAYSALNQSEHRIGELSGQLERLFAATGGQAAERRRPLAERVAAVEAALQQPVGQADDGLVQRALESEAELERLRAELALASAEAAHLREQSAAADAQARAEIDSVSGEEAEALRRSLAETQAERARLEEQLDERTAEIDRLGERVSGLLTHMETLQSQIGHLDADELQLRSAELDQRQRELEDRQRALEARPRPATGAIANPGDAVLRERLESAESELARVAEEAAAIREALRQQLTEVEDERLRESRTAEDDRHRLEAEVDALRAEAEAAVRRSEQGSAGLGAALATAADSAEWLAELCEDSAEPLGVRGAGDELVRCAGDLRAAAGTLRSAAQRPDPDAVNEARALLAGAAASFRRLMSEHLERLAARDREASGRGANTESLEARIDELDQALTHEQDRLAEALARAEDSEQALRSTRARLEQERSAVQTAQARVQTLEHEIGDLRGNAEAEQEHSENRIAELSAALERAQQTLEQTQDRAEATDARLKILDDRHAAASAAVRGLRDALLVLAGARSEPAISSAADELRTAADDEIVNQLDASTARGVVHAGARLAGLAIRRREDLGGAVDRAEAALTSLREQAANAASERDRLRDERDRLTARVAQAEERLSAVGSEAERSGSELATRTADLAAARERAAGLEADLRSSRERASELEARIEELETALEGLGEARERAARAEARVESETAATHQLSHGIRQLANDAAAYLDQAGLLGGAASRRLTRSSQAIGRAEAAGDSVSAAEAGVAALSRVGDQLDVLHRELLNLREARQRAEQERVELVARAELAESEAIIGGQAATERDRLQAERLAALDELNTLRGEVTRLTEAAEAARRSAEQATRIASAERDEISAMHQAAREELESQAREASERAQQLDLALTEARNRLDQLESEHAAAQSAGEARQLDLERQLDERSADLARLERELEALRRDRRETVGLQARIEALNGKLAALNRENGELRADRERLGGREAVGAAAAQARQARDEAERRAARLERELAAEQARLSAIERATAGIRSRYEEREASTEAERRELSGQIEALQARLRGVERENAGLKARLRSLTRDDSGTHRASAANDSSST